MPTEHELASSYGVSRLTVRKAKAYLAEEGLLRSIQGSGSFVTRPEGKRSEPIPVLETLEDVFDAGQQLAFQLLDCRMVPNSDPIARKLNNREDHSILQITGVRYSNSEPLSHVTYHFPFRIGSRLPVGSLDKTSYVPQIERLLGVKVMLGVHAFLARRAGKHVSRLLGIQPGAPVLVVEALYLDEDHRPIEYVVSQYRPETRYRVRMKREGISAAEGGAQVGRDASVRGGSNQ
jgi:GntR family transcriptional regulator